MFIIHDRIYTWLSIWYQPPLPWPWKISLSTHCEWEVRRHSCFNPFGTPLLGFTLSIALGKCISIELQLIICYNKGFKIFSKAKSNLFFMRIFVHRRLNLRYGLSSLLRWKPVGGFPGQNARNPSLVKFQKAGNPPVGLQVKTMETHHKWWISSF